MWYTQRIADRLRRRARSPQSGSGRRTVYAIALICAVAAVVWWALAGYHAGFLTLNRLLAVLPAGALQIVTYAGDSLIALTLLLCFARRAPTLLWHGALAAVVATLVSRGLKIALDAARPPAVLAHDAFRIVGPAYTTHGFPSGHATTAFVAAALFAWNQRSGPIRLLMFVVATAIAVSRIAAGVHWPVDVLAGAAIGCASVVLTASAAARWRWGLTPAAHLTVVVILAGCAIGLLLIRIPYPAATLPARALAAGALSLTIWDYVWDPLRSGD